MGQRPQPQCRQLADSRDWGLGGRQLIAVKGALNAEREEVGARPEGGHTGQAA